MILNCVACVLAIFHLSFACTALVFEADHTHTHTHTHTQDEQNNLLDLYGSIAERQVLEGIYFKLAAVKVWQC